MFKKLFKKNTTQHPTDLQGLLEKSMQHVGALQAGHEQNWNLGKEERFGIDFERNTIRWIFADGKIVTADATLIGTWTEQNTTFLWGFDHPHCPPADNQAALLVQTYANQHNIEFLTEPEQSCAEMDVWSLAAIAVLLGDLQGVYRAPSRDTGSIISSFIGFNNVKVSTLH